MTTITIKNGTFKGQRIANKTYTLIQGYRVQNGNGIVTVDGSTLNGKRSASINIKPNDFVINVDSSVKRGRPAKSAGLTVSGSLLANKKNDLDIDLLPEVETNESDEGVLARINRRFDILNKMTLGARNGTIRALIVAGAPGVGKTFGVQKTLEETGMIEIFSGESQKFQIVSGTASPVGLYMKLYEFREENNVLVFDDCDDIFQDETMLNLMKSALDTSAKRMIHWNVDSVSLRKGDVPNSFEFKGSVIFITNVDFKRVRGQKKNHIEALQSRAFYLDLTVHTHREKMLRIEDLVYNKDMLSQFKLTNQQNKELMAYINKNAARFDNLSLRTVIKVANIIKTNNNHYEDGITWQEMADATLCGNL